MTTSGSYDNSTTLNNIIKDAYSLIGVLDPTQSLPAEYFSEGKRKLNQLLSIASTHRGLWLINEVEVTLTPGTSSYTVGVGETVDTPKPNSILHVRRSESIDIPIEIVSHEEYFNVPNKTLQAPANLIYYSPGNLTGTLYVWPTGTTSDNTLKLKTQRPVQDFDIAGDDPDFPKEWDLLITYMLAEMLAPQYLAGLVPPGIASTVMKLLSSVMTFDAEHVTIQIQPT